MMMMMLNDQPPSDNDAPPAAMRIPLDEVSFSTRSMGSGTGVNEKLNKQGDHGEEEEDSLVSDISCSDQDEATEQPLQAKMVDAVPRSIFSSYWKGGDNAAAVSKEAPIKRSSNPPTKRVLFPSKHQEKQDCCESDHFQFLGIENKLHRQSSEGENSFSSLNTYERILQQHEKPPSPPKRQSSFATYGSRPFWMTFFEEEGRHASASEPHLASRMTHHHRNVYYSDTALIRKPKKSCLRRGRFSPPRGDDDDGDHQQRRSSKVSFQSTIQVRVFEAPVERFAHNGWSQWFG